MEMEHRVLVYCRELENSTAGEQHRQGRELLQEALEREYQLSFSEDMVGFTANGKPVLKELPIFFSISHCRGMVVCAISDVPVGVDVETGRRVSDTLMEKVLSPEEQAYVRGYDVEEKSSSPPKPESLTEQEINRRFLRLWTLKESYLKMTGEGLRVPLHTVSFQLGAAPKWKLQEQIRCNRPGYFYQTEINGGFVLSICTKELPAAPHIRFSERVSTSASQEWQ